MHDQREQQQQRIHQPIAPRVTPPLPEYQNLCGGERCVYEAALQAFGIRVEPPKLEIGFAPFLQSNGTVQWQAPYWQMAAQQVSTQQMFTQQTPSQQLPPNIAPTQSLAEHAPTELPPVFILCFHCHTPFDVSRNHEMACVRHRYDKPVVKDTSIVWVGWDDRFCGPKDIPQIRELFPNAFMWPCCGRPGKAIGCMSDAHVPKRDEDFVMMAAMWAANAGKPV